MRRHLWKKQLNNERGATLVLIAVSLVALLGAAAIAIDLAMLYDARNDAQKTADAAALAGASIFLPPGVPAGEEVAQATQRAHTFGGMNAVGGIAVNPDEMQVEVLLDEAKVRVTVTRTDIPLWFARIFGLNTSTVAARAAAVAEMSGSVTCMRPIAFADLWHEQVGPDPLRYTGLPSTTCAWGDPNCDYYANVETGRGMWWRNAGMPGPDGKGLFEAPAKPDDVGRQLTFYLNDNSGNFDETSTERLYKNRFYPLRIPGCSGGDCWRQGLAGEACTGKLSIGDNVVTEPGVQVGPTNQGLTAARDDDPLAYWDDATNTIKGSRYPLGCSGDACTGEGSKRIFSVAMVHPASRILYNASGTFPIQNFGAFFLETWQAGGSGTGGTWIQVRWLKPRSVQDDCEAQGNCRENLRTLRLVE